MATAEPRVEAGACSDEDGLAALVEGRLAGDALVALEEHLDRCDRCQAAFGALARLRSTAAPPRPATRPLAPGERLGRYTIAGEVGRGATSVVYEAHDPKLDRPVALKLIDAANASRATELGARLVDEARAMARLSHPNVLAVFDTGAVEQTVFIAMELVAGQTLGGFVRARRRPVAEVVRAYVAAGRGLEAAHAAGLVHRDFKPDNVLVDRGGRVLVTDFGLAVAGRSDEEASVGDLRITRTGGLVGTPAYMAPEQVDGAGDARSDQFSFAVALYEAVAGRRPFAGDSFDAILANVRRGRIVAPLAPRWLDRAVRRALAADPAERWPAMGALLAALERGLRAPRWPFVAAVPLAAALAGGAVMAASSDRQIALACSDWDAALIGVWDDSLRGRLSSTFRATGLPYADDVARGVVGQLDAYAREWTLRRADVCQAGNDGRWSPKLTALADACFAERLASLGAAVDILTRTDRKMLNGTTNVVPNLDDVATCSSPARLGPWQAESTDPTWRARKRKLVGDLATIRAELDVNRRKEALAALPAVVAEARALNHDRAQAQAALLTCEAQAPLGNVAAAEAECHRAAQLAAATGSPDIAARVWSYLAGVVGSEGGRYAEADRWADYARAALIQSGGNPLTEGSLELSVGVLAKQRGRLDDARGHYLKALAAFERVYGADSLPVGKVLNNLGILENVANDRTRAMAYHRRAIAIRTEKLGGRHPDVAVSLLNLALTESKSGEHAVARKSLDRALEISLANLPADHPQIGIMLANRALFADREGRPAEAVGDLERALAITERTHGGKHPKLAVMLDNLGRVRQQLGEAGAALALHTRALAIGRAALGDAHPDVLDSHEKRAEALMDLGRLREAATHLRHAVSIRRAGDDRASTAWALRGLARLERLLGRLPAADAAVREGLAVAGPDGDPQTVAELRFEGAEVKLSRGEVEAAVAQARAALADAERAIDGALTAAKIRAWLAARDG